MWMGEAAEANLGGVARSVLWHLDHGYGPIGQVVCNLVGLIAHDNGDLVG
jgi:hypothetical protein